MFSFMKCLVCGNVMVVVNGRACCEVCDMYYEYDKFSRALVAYSLCDGESGVVDIPSGCLLVLD